MAKGMWYFAEHFVFLHWFKYILVQPCKLSYVGGRVVPLLGRRGAPHLTVVPGPRSTFLPSGMVVSMLFLFHLFWTSFALARNYPDFHLFWKHESLYRKSSGIEKCKCRVGSLSSFFLWVLTLRCSYITRLLKFSVTFSTLVFSVWSQSLASAILCTCQELVLLCGCQ